MPVIMPDRATYKCDLRFGEPVGRISRSLGTTDKREYRQRCALLRDLYAARQLKVLIAFRDGEITIQQLLAVKREKRLSDDAIEGELILRPTAVGYAGGSGREVAGQGADQRVVSEAAQGAGEVGTVRDGRDAR